MDTSNQSIFFSDGIKVIPRSPLKRDLLMNHLIKDKFLSLREQLTDFPGFQINIKDQLPPFNGYRNAYDIERKDLLDQIIRMRSNFLQPSSRYSKLVDDDSRHSLPISQMGNYQDHLKKMPMPLREIESAPVRQHMFGNPFKINKNMIMDEVVLDEVSLVPNGGSSAPQPKKRPQNAAEQVQNNPTKRLRKGPLPKDFAYRSGSNSPVHIKELPESPQDLTPPQTPEPEVIKIEETNTTETETEAKAEIKQEEENLPSIIIEEIQNNENNEPKQIISSPVKAEKPVKIETKLPEWDNEERRKSETRNNNMRQIIYKEVKRPGRNYDRLLELLKELHGPADIRQQYIIEVIKEANRFKRNHMAQTILQLMPNLVSIDSSS